MKKIPDNQQPPHKSQIVIYKDPRGGVKIDVRFDGDTVWLTQDALSELFEKGRSTIAEHIQNIFTEGELDVESVCREFRRTGTDGKEYLVKYYNLELIIAVGYRVKSPQGIAFRTWATARLSEYIVKGFVIDSDRLKNPDVPFDYFEELERTIADIRSSEKRFYRKITDIYATSVDYDPTNDQSLLFFKTVQNKVHYAIMGSTTNKRGGGDCEKLLYQRRIVATQRTRGAVPRFRYRASSSESTDDNAGLDRKASRFFDHQRQEHIAGCRQHFT